MELLELSKDSNLPGSRDYASARIDSSSNYFLLFGGNGYDNQTLGIYYYFVFKLFLFLLLLLLLLIIIIRIFK